MPDRVRFHFAFPSRTAIWYNERTCSAACFVRVGRWPVTAPMGTVADRTFSRLGDRAMAFQDGPTTRDIGEVSRKRLSRPADAYRTRLTMAAASSSGRSSAEREVKSGDRVQGGVAPGTREEIRVHPYVFRQVCANGAIIAHATESRYLAAAEFQLDSVEAFVAALREAVQACCGADAFERAADEMSSSIQSDFDPALTLMPMLSRLPPKIAAEVLPAILGRFFEGGDMSRFGFMNAVTSVARDTRDPETRWDLEEIGGGIPAKLRAAGAN